MMIALMLEGDSDVQKWYGDFGFTFPILADPSYAGSNNIGLGGGIPHHVLIGRDMTMQVYMYEPSEAEIEAALAQEWPDVDYPEPPATGAGDDDDDDADGDDDDDAGAPATASNPFARAVGEEAWGSGACAVGGPSRGTWALALLLPLLAWRRR
jgi:hypothetical protein